MLTRLLTGKYAEHPRSEQFVRWVLTKGLMEQPNHPEDAAHLHVNLEKEYRWGGVARRLWSLYENRLRAVGLNHYYAEFFSCPQRNPESMYARCGFKLYDRSVTTMFQPEISDPVSIVCAHKVMDDPLFRLSLPRQHGHAHELHS
jgi:GNAT superfamily N-acetyltransferase